MAVEKTPLVNYNFCLRVEGKTDLPCKKIYGFEYGNEYEYIKEGGLNDYVHIRRKPASKPNTFKVERYVGMETTDYLAMGTHFTMPLLLLISGKSADFSEAGRTYAFIGCTVVKKSIGDVDAQQSGLMTETITIAYQQLLCMDK